MMEVTYPFFGDVKKVSVINEIHPQEFRVADDLLFRRLVLLLI